MNCFVRTGFLFFFIVPVFVHAQSEIKVFDNQKDVIEQVEPILHDLSADQVMVAHEAIQELAPVVQDIVDVSGAELLAEPSVVDFTVTDSLALVSCEPVLNAKLVGDREDIEKIVTQVIEKEFLKRDKESSFGLRHVVVGVVAAFCFGVVCKYFYDDYCKQVSLVEQRLLVLEKNYQEVNHLKKTVADMKLQLVKEINDMNEYLNNIGGKKRSLAGSSGGRNVNFSFNNTTIDSSTQSGLGDGLATVGAVIGASAKVVTSSGFCSCN